MVDVGLCKGVTGMLATTSTYAAVFEPHLFSASDLFFRTDSEQTAHKLPVCAWHRILFHGNAFRIILSNAQNSTAVYELNDNN